MATPALVIETTFPGEMKSGTSGIGRLRVQEWLTFHGHGVTLDAQFGPATAEAVRSFQAEQGIPATGIVDQTTWSRLVAPMVRATTLRHPAYTLNEAIIFVAKSHLAEHPREIGGQNRGPWVRLYCDGNEGDAWAWCAGFATYVVKQARTAETFADDVSPGGGIRTYSCDAWANGFRADGMLLPQATKAQVQAKVKPGCIFFLVDPKNLNDRHHTGIVTEVAADGSWVKTIEGNTNDEGSREGYEVCARTRGVGKLDFGIIAKRA